VSKHQDDIADPNFKISLSNEKTEGRGSGNLAYRRGTFTSLLRTRRQTAENAAGTYYRLQEAGGGSWKRVEDFGV